METIREYLLKVVSAALICGMIREFFSGTKIKEKSVKFITGIFMIICLISPLLSKHKINWDRYWDIYLQEGIELSQSGMQDSLREQKELIKSNTESYILSKAKHLSALVQVNVCLSESPPYIPEKITVKGGVSPYVKKELQHVIAEDLNISGENQTWIQ